MHPSLFPGLRPANSLVVLIDDSRAFRDRRPHVQVRRGDHAVELLRVLGERQIDELWLDYDHLGGTTSQPAVEHLVARAERGDRPSVKVIEVHSARIPEALHITQRLRRAGYPARRCYAQGIWTRFDAAHHDEWRSAAGIGISDHRGASDYETAARAGITGSLHA